MGKCQAASSTLTPSHPPGEAASMTNSLAKRTKRHQSCRVITPSSDPFSFSRQGLISFITTPTFLRTESLKTRKLEDLKTSFLFSKSEQDPLKYFTFPFPPTPRCNLTTIPTLAVKGRTNSRHFGHQDLDPGQHDFLRQPSNLTPRLI